MRRNLMLGKHLLLASTAINARLCFAVGTSAVTYQRLLTISGVPLFRAQAGIALRARGLFHRRVEGNSRIEPGRCDRRSF